MSTAENVHYLPSAPNNAQSFESYWEDCYFSLSRISRHEAHRIFYQRPDKFFIDAGWVYVLKNPFMAGICKVGRTAGCPLKRANQLRSTGVPGGFDLHYAYWFANCIRAERSIHESLSEFRVDEGREFFQDRPTNIKNAFAFCLLEEERVVPEHMRNQYLNRRSDAEEYANHAPYSAPGVEVPF